MIKLIIFDFGGVIGCDSDDWNNTFKIIPKLTRLSSVKLQRLFEFNWPKLKIGVKTMKDFWQQVAQNSKTKISPAKLRSAYNKSITANFKMLNFVKKLSQEYKTVILMNESNDGEKIKIKKFKLNKITAKVYSSATLGIGKPNKKVFLIVLKDQNVKKDEVVFIDNQENSIQASKALGIKSILFKNLTQLKKELVLLLSQ